MVYDGPTLHERQQIGEPHKKYQSVIDHFDSLEEFLLELRRQEHLFDRDTLAKERIDSRLLASEYNIKQMFLNQKGRGELHFNMCKSFSDAVRLAEYGWPEGRERVAQKEAEIRNLMRDMIDAPSFFHNHVGEEVDVPEFLMGTPEHMIGYDVMQTRHKFLRITVDVNCRCDACGRRSHDAQPNPPEWAMIRGAVVSLLVRALLRYGFEVEVVVGAVAFHHARYYYGPNHSSGFNLRDSFKHTTSITVHRPGWLFDFDRLVFATAHEGFTRKLLFRHEEAWLVDKLGRYPSLDWDANPSPVGHLNRSEAHKPEYMPELGDSDIHFDSFPVLVNRLRDEGNLDYQGWGEDPARKAANDTFATVQAGARWVLDKLREVGVVFR